MYMRRNDIIPTARMTDIRFKCKTADATLEEFKILYKEYKVKVLSNIEQC